MGSKKSKKSKKKSKEPKSVKHINPFQIEDAAADTTYQESNTASWEGDYYWSDEEEQAGLLVGAPHRYEHPQPSASGPSSGFNRLLCVFASMVFGFWILLASTVRDDDGDTTPANVGPPSLSPTTLNLIPAPTTTYTTGSPIRSTPPMTLAPSQSPTGSIDAWNVPAPVPTNGTDDNSIVDATNSPTIDESNDDEWNVPEQNEDHASHISHKPAYFIVVGERHSGVEWMVEQLKQHCGDHHPVSSGFRRPGYWFQIDSTTNSTDDKKFWQKVHLHYTPQLIVMVRNPVDWFRALFEHPDFAPDAPRSTLREFLVAPWTTTTTTTPNTTSATSLCQYDFGPHQVTPCLSSDSDMDTNTPVYELDDKGSIFRNVAALRAAKIHHWTTFLPSTYWRIETTHILPIETAVTTGYNFTATCQVPPPSQAAVVTPPTTIITKGYRSWLNSTVDWTMEERIGYDRGT